MALPGLVAANNLADAVDRERAWDNIGSSLATGDIAIPAPSLDLNFAANKSLVDDISGNNLITFSRASTGTFVGSNGLIQTAASGVPRFDHNPVTGESLGLLVEEARPNLASRSEDFSNATWTKNNITVTPNIAIAPDGTITADKATTNNGAASWYMLQTLGSSPSTSSCSVYAKAAGWDFVSVGRGFVFGGGDYAIFNLQTGTVSRAPTFTGSTASITHVGSEWYRCVLVSPQTDNNFHVTPQGAGTSVGGGAPDGTDGVFLWGAQLEAGSFPTSYIPTVASTVTRAADVASITGANFSSWFNPAVGTFFTESSNDPLTSDIARSAYDTVNTVAFSLGAGAGRVYTPTLGHLSNNTIIAFLFQFDGEGTEWGPHLQNTLSNTANVRKVAVFTDITNGLAGISTAGQINTSADPGPGRTGELSYSLAQSMVIGYNSNYYGNYTGRIKRIAYWPSRLIDKALQYITQPSITSVNVYSFSFAVKGRDVLALEGVRNTSTRDFIFIKGLLSAAQPRLTAAAVSTSSGLTLATNALPKLSPTSSGNYLFASGLTLSGVTTRINGTNALSIATSPFSGSTATAPLLFRELRPQANWRITEPMPSGTIASPEIAIPFETNDFVLFIKAGQN